MKVSPNRVRGGAVVYHGGLHVDMQTSGFTVPMELALSAMPRQDALERLEQRDLLGH